MENKNSSDDEAKSSDSKMKVGAEEIGSLFDRLCTEIDYSEDDEESDVDFDNYEMEEDAPDIKMDLFKGEGFDDREAFGSGPVAPLSTAYPSEHFKPMFRKLKSHPRCSRLTHPIRLVSRNAELFLSSRERDNYVGTCRSDIDLDIEDFDLSEFHKYSSDVSGRGTSQGFSMFCHSLVVFTLARSKPNSIIEPWGGSDLRLEEGDVEVCADLKNKDEFRSQFLIDKYRFISSLFDFEQYLSLSSDEDSGRFTSFLGSAFDQGEDAYSNTNRKIMQTISELTLESSEILGVYTKHYILKVNRAPNEDKDTWVSVGEHLLTELKRCIGKNGKYASPVRVTFGNPQIPDFELPDGFTYDWETSASTTKVLDEIPKFSDFLTEVECKIPGSYTDPFKKMKNELRRYEVFQSAEIEASLVSKVVGFSGEFFMRKWGVGISWWRVASNIWNINYYKPGKSQDKGWSFSQGVSMSPTFRLSKRDADYAMLLPGRIIAVICSTSLVVSMEFRKQVLAACIKLLCCYKNSSWNDSAIMKDMRFLVCCHFSRSGDVKKLARVKSESKHPSVSNFYNLLLVYEYAQRMSIKEDFSKSPLFELPVATMALEKDITLGYMWHILPNQHDTKCMQKSLDNITKRKELENQDLKYAEREYEFLVKGGSFQEFREILDQGPEHPHFSYLFFYGLVILSKDKLEQSSGLQKPTSFKLHSMMSDSGSVRVVQGEMVTGKMYTNISAIMSENKSRSAHELLVSQKNGPKLENIFGMFAKDHGKSDREISIMDAQMRPRQFYCEAMSSLYNQGFSEDMMNDPKKYTNMAKGITEFMKGKNLIASSEDRKFFCGNIRPENLGSAMGMVSKWASNTGLVTASGLMLCDTSRSMAMPFNYQGDFIFDRFMNRVRAGKKTLVGVAKTRHHMMQGIYAGCAALLNTVYCLAFENCFQSATGATYKVMTTSDDVTRQACSEKGFTASQCNFFYETPRQLLPKAMMMDAPDKVIKSCTFVEMNNMVVTKGGVISQSPIHAMIIPQMLLGKDPVHDLVSVVSVARSALFWGNSPDLLMVIFWLLCDIFCQKWLVETSFIMTLQRNKFLPDCVEDLISGFAIRSEGLLKTIYKNLNASCRKEYDDGADMQSVMSKFLARDERERFLATIPDGGIRLKTASLLISRSRIKKNRLRQDYIKPVSVKRAKDMIASFKKLITGDPFDGPIPIVKNPMIVSHLSRPKKSDRRPTSLGNVRELPGLDFNSIFTKFYTRGYWKDNITEEEAKIAGAEIKEIEKKFEEDLMKPRTEGFVAQCPAGKPLTYASKGGSSIVMRTFDYQVIFDAEVYSKSMTRCLMFRGSEIKGFEPIILGGSTLSDCLTIRNKVKSCVHLAYGSGYIDGKKNYFYFHGSDQKRCILEHKKNEVFLHTQGHCSIIIVPWFDYSALNFNYHGMDPTAKYPGLAGDVNAILNYGGWCRSNDRSGFRIYKDLLDHLGLFCPDFVRKTFPLFPYFHKDAEDIPSSEVTSFVGCDMIMLCRLGRQDGTSFKEVDVSEKPRVLKKKIVKGLR